MTVFWRKVAVRLGFAVGVEFAVRHRPKSTGKPVKVVRIHMSVCQAKSSPFLEESSRKKRCAYIVTHFVFLGLCPVSCVCVEKKNFKETAHTIEKGRSQRKTPIREGPKFKHKLSKR